jgi:hypothetical protein
MGSRHRIGSVSIARRVRRRWWIGIIPLVLVGLAAVIRLVTMPLEVSASVADGDQAVARTAILDFKFNKDMLASSVQQAFRIDPAVPIVFRAVGPREFQFTPTMKPETAYHVLLNAAKEASGSGTVTQRLSFRTEPAPTVAVAKFDDQPLREAAQFVPVHGRLAVAFSQPMDPARTPLLLDGRPVEGARWQWSADGLSAVLDVTLKHSKPYQLTVPQQSLNRKHDPLLTDWKLTFTTVMDVPSAGDPARIGAGAPILMQIENSLDARPQAGMQQADMIYEYLSEGSVPRLTAVYWHPLPELVGPIRSCRLITIQLEMMYKGFIYCSGANDYVLGKVWKFPDLVNDFSYGQGNVFFRASNRWAPHNVMIHGVNATNFAAGKNVPAPQYEVAPKHEDAVVTGPPASAIEIPDHGASWKYDPTRKEYLKWQDGAPMMNIGTGQVHAKTVIVEHVTSYVDTNPANTFCAQGHCYHTEYYELAGEGQAEIYVNGTVIHGSWKHANRDVPAAYYTQDGDPITLDTGLTWVHVLGSTVWHSGI